MCQVWFYKSASLLCWHHVSQARLLVLGGQPALWFMLHYPLLLALSLILHSPAVAGPAPALGAWPRARDSLFILWSVIIDRSLFRERGFQGRKANFGCLWVLSLHRTEGPSEAGFAGASIWCPTPLSQYPQLSTMGRDKWSFTTGGS